MSQQPGGGRMLLRKPTGLWFACSAVGYCALWLLVPRATLLSGLADAIRAVMPFAGDGARPVLASALLGVTAAPTVAFMAVQIALVYFFAQFDMNWRQCALVLVGSLAAVAVIALGIVWQSGVSAKMGRHPSIRETLVIMGAYPSLLRMPMYLGIILASSSIGFLVSLRVRDRNMLLPVVMLAAYIDFWTVTRGPVSVVLKKAPEVVAAVAAPIPAVGTGAFVPRTLVGPGDFLFMALVFAAAHRLGLNGPRNYWFVFGGMTLGMLAVLFGLLPALPALVVLAVTVVVANWGKFKLTRHEAVSTAVVGLVLLASLPLVWSALSPGPQANKTHKAGSPGDRR
ncbi:MAG: hypothetical protein ACP5R5_02270 [Armatimonadota bacterium]